MLARDGFFTNLLSTVFEPRWAGKAAQDGRSIIEQCNDLIQARGDTAVLRLAGSILASYAELSDEGRFAFFQYLAQDLELDPQAVTEAATAFGEEGSAENLAALMVAAEPARQTLFRKLNHGSRGVAAAGMGLALVRRAAESLGGSCELSAADESGRGLRARVIIPRARVQALYSVGSSTTRQ